TVLYPNVRTMAETKRRRAAGERILAYGRRGTPTTFALEEVLAELEQGAGAKLFCSGLAAIALTFASFLKPGDHVLIIDSCYEPVRR
ncbi:PLP-dependent transferase, partial [Acinetobacter baumannii]